MFKLFKKKNKFNNQIEIDEDIIKESYRSQKREIPNPINYNKKTIDWLREHLKIIDDVVNKHTLGDKRKGSFILEGRKFFKTDITKKLYNDMFDNYTAYFFALKRYIIIRNELERLHELGDEEYFVAGKEKQLNIEATKIEENLNIYLDNIKRAKLKIREEVFK